MKFPRINSYLLQLFNEHILGDMYRSAVHDLLLDFYKDLMRSDVKSYTAKKYLENIKEEKLYHVPEWKE